MMFYLTVYGILQGMTFHKWSDMLPLEITAAKPSLPFRKMSPSILLSYQVSISCDAIMPNVHYSKPYRYSVSVHSQPETVPKIHKHPSEEVSSHLSAMTPLTLRL